MTEKKLLIGSLSNDLFRVANLTYRGATNASIRFVEESRKWASSLLKEDLPPYLSKIVQEVAISNNKINMKTAEKYLMYGILLQNYTLHIK